jgi:hypothetical protein
MKKFLYAQIVLLLIALTAHAQIPANDNFATAQELSGLVTSATNDNQNATTEIGEPAATGYRSLWYTWTAPASGQLAITTAGSDNFSVNLTVWMGNSVSDVKSVYADDTSFPSIEIPVVAGTVYYICTGSYYSSQFGNIQINLSLNTSSPLDTLNFIGTATTAENDNFVNRILTSTEFGSYVAYNGSDTREALETTPGYSTIWWDYHAPANGVLDINDVGDGTYTFSKYMSVYSGTAVQNLELLIPAVTGGDCYIPVIQGNDYQICVSSYYSSQSGPIMLTFSLNPNSGLNAFNLNAGATVTNDNFNSATVLTGATPGVVSYNSYATREALEPSGDGYSTIWFSWTAPASGLTQILNPQITQLNGVDGFDKYITVYTGAAINSLTQVAQAHATYPQVNLTAVAGQTYYIAVGSYYSSQSGPIVLALFAQPGTPTGPTLSISQAFKLKFATVTNTTYKVQQSSDLRTWNSLTNTITGNGLEQQVFVDPNGAQNLSYRLTAQ